MGLPKLIDALFEQAVFFRGGYLLSVHSVSQLSGTDCFLLDSSAALPENLEVEPGFVVLLLPQLVIVDKQSTFHHDSDANVDGFSVGYRLASKMGIFNPICNLADEALDAVIGVPLGFHAVLVLLPVSLVRFAVED